MSFDLLQVREVSVFYLSSVNSNARVCERSGYADAKFMAVSTNTKLLKVYRVTVRRALKPTRPSSGAGDDLC